MVNTVVEWISRVGVMLIPEIGRARLRRDIGKRLRQGTIERMRVIEAARAGHEDADHALREFIAEMIDHGEELPTTLAAYAQEAMFRPPAVYPPGQNIAGTWLRNVTIAGLVAMACATWGLKPTRNRASTRPSGASVVAPALKRCGFDIGERQVERIYNEHTQVAFRLSASLGG